VYRKKKDKTWEGKLFFVISITLQPKLRPNGEVWKKKYFVGRGKEIMHFAMGGRSGGMCRMILIHRQ
jgi:hypothetical protein